MRMCAGRPTLQLLIWCPVLQVEHAAAAEPEHVEDIHTLTVAQLKAKLGGYCVEIKKSWKKAKLLALLQDTMAARGE